MPNSFSRQQLASLSRAIAVTIARRVQPNTSKSYARKVKAFDTFCWRSGCEPEYDVPRIRAFMQHYVAGFGQVKVHAYTSLAQFMSAWRDNALFSGKYFPDKGSDGLLRISKFVKSLAAQYPHVPATHLALTLRRIRDVAFSLGILSPAHLETCPRRHLAILTRLLVGHAAMLRGVEHKFGARLSDLHVFADHFELEIGKRDTEAKYKQRPRRVGIEISNSHLSAGAVLHVYLRRVFTARMRSRANVPLFPTFSVHGSATFTGWKWKDFRVEMASIASAIGFLGVIGETSLRAGGATDAFAAGASDQYVRTQGGWRSDAYRRYDRPTAQQRRWLGRRIMEQQLRNSSARRYPEIHGQRLALAAI